MRGLRASRAPLAERSAVNRQVLGSIPSGGAVFFFSFLAPGPCACPVTRGEASVHTGGSSAVEQRTVKCASAYAVILWSGVQISPPGYFFPACLFWALNHARRSHYLGAHIFSVHSTRVVFIPSKDKIRVRVPMDARGIVVHGSIQPSQG